MQKPSKLWFFGICCFVFGIAAACLIMFGVLPRANQAGGRQEHINQSATAKAPQFKWEALQQQNNTAAYIAHAGGGIDGITYTNSLEAFKRNYQRGFRIFELDLVLLKNNDVLVAHDGLEKDYGLDKPFSETSLDEVKTAKYKGKYTVLTVPELIRLMREYADALIVLDTKGGDHPAILRNVVAAAKGDETVLDRLVPHVSGKANIDAVRSVYPFKLQMLALYRLLAEQNMTEDEIIQLIESEKLSAVMMWKDTKDPVLTLRENNSAGKVYSQEFRDKLAQKRIPAYVHSIDAPEEGQKFRDVGIGYYSNEPIGL